jgi:glutamate-ammonia-ligase adenylyltransferase
VTQLSHRTGFQPDLDGAIAQLCTAGLISVDLAPAYGLLTRYLVVSRLVTPDSAEPPEDSRWLVAKACGTENWAELLARIASARQIIGTAWQAMIAHVPADADDVSQPSHAS